MKFPIRATLTAVFILFATITVSIVVIINFTGAWNTLLTSAKVEMSASADNAEREIGTLIAHSRKTADVVSHLPAEVFDRRSTATLLAILKAELRSFPEMYGVYVGFADGSFVQAVSFLGPNGQRRKVAGMPDDAVSAIRIIRPADDSGTAMVQTWRYFDKDGKPLSEATRTGTDIYDPRPRPWFVAANDLGHFTRSKVYVFASLKEPGVTASAPLLHVPGAVVGVDLPLSDLAGLMRRIRPGKNGLAAIYRADGNMVAHPDTRNVVSHTTDNGVPTLVPVVAVNDVRLKTAIDTLGNSQQRSVSFAADGSDYIAYFKPLERDGLTDWRFVSIASVDDYTGPLVTTLYRSLGLVTIVLLLTVWGMAVLAGWIASPIVRLRNMADRITDMNLEPIEQLPSRFDEVKSLRQSMEHMRDAMDTFLRFVPRELVKELVSSGQSVDVGGTRREVTVLFTDVEDFTRATERMTPEQVMAQTSRYFEQMTFVIQANRGTIDKFIGDGIMAIWNAPSDDEFHVENACRAALTARQVSEELNKDLVAAGSPPMRTRFGLHTGEALVGNIGARDRMQYTCIGACVNLASRIEGLNKHFGTQILVSDTIRRQAGSGFIFRRVDIVMPKGATIPITIYELMGERTVDAPFYVGADEIKRASKYEQAFDFYLHQDFENALELLEALCEETPDDAVSRLMRNRCITLINDPPPNTWNGVTALDQK